MPGESHRPTPTTEDTVGLGQGAAATAVVEPGAATRIGPYRLLQIIGEGGMGEVWQAEQLEPVRRRVAVKVIKAGMDTKEVVARFESERQALALMDHPAIAKVFDAGSTPEGRPYFVMEYVAGLSITEHCDTHKLDTEQRLKLFIEVCDGVQHAHQKAILHRDLKPSNILVSLTDGKAQPKIIDFGIAKATGQRLTEKTFFTEVGAIIGTPEYMSPEQADLRGQDVDTRTDIYSLGVILYQLLTGELPFGSQDLRSGNYEDLRRKLRDVEPMRPSTRLGTLGDGGATAAKNRSSDPRSLLRILEGDLDAITMKAMEKERGRRYGTPSELAADIGRHLRHEPVLARPPSQVYRIRKYVQRHRVGVAVASGLMILLMAFAATMAIQAGRLARARHEAEVQRSRAQRGFDDVRKLATSFVFEFHDAIADLAGATAARQLVVSKGLEYLDRLAADAEHDRSLQSELADAYERMSDIQGNPFASNVGDVQASLESTRKATAIREALAKNLDPQSPEGLAYRRSLLRLGVAYQATGRVKDAAELYRRVVAASDAALQRDAENVETRRILAHASHRLCASLMALGDSAAAIGSCQRSVSSYDELLGRPAPNVQLKEEATEAMVAYANALRLTGRGEEALTLNARAIDSLETLAKENPTNGKVRLELATALARQGTIEAGLSRDGAAVDSYRQAVDAFDGLLAADPINQRIRTLLSYVLLRRSPTLLRAGHADKASASTRRGLGLLRAQAERATAGPTDLNEYAFWLLTCVPDTERRPSEALRFARRAVESQANPVFLDTLALAYFQTGAAADAVKTEERALAMLPPVASGSKPTGLRSEIESHLAQFRNR
jgi:serine/threonine protein kinase/tetratricopeptide (TPR) repeat protein